MNNARAALSGAGGGSLTTNVIYVLVSFVIVYAVYRLVYPQKDPREALVLEFNDGASAQSKTTDTDQDNLPLLFTGGECTLAFWMYVSDWEVRSGRMKHVVTLKGAGANYNSIVCGIYPLENKLMIRVRTAGTNTPSGVGANAANTVTTSGTEYTDTTAYTNLFGPQNAGMKDFMNTVNYPLCDLPEFDLQRWVHVNIVVNGRVCDVYLDGKLSRSCMLDNVIQFPKAVGSAGVTVDACQFGGFGGALSKVQLFSYAITPDRAYSIYQAGPTLKSNTLVDRLLALFGINLTYSAYKVTPPQASCSSSKSVNVPGTVANALDSAGLTTSGTLGNILSNPMAAAGGQ
jgi:hypothetical protein